ncbi:hypothetical protein D3C83_83350 [compost metagenome]
MTAPPYQYWTSSLGVTSSPSITNIVIWESHDSPSCTRRMFREACSGMLPRMTPAM